jgi:serine phosphatase RsbU (regulator of sigma subunit)/CHASE3 domain sensor protein
VTTLHTTIDDAPSERAFTRNLRKNSYSPALSLFLLVAILVSILAYLLYTMTWVDHTDRVIEQALSTEKILLDLQTSIRGYALSGDPSFLTPVDASRPLLLPSLASLRSIVADNPPQVALATQIGDDATRWLALADTYINTANPATRPTPEQIHQGQSTFDPIRANLTTFLQNEYTNRNTRSARTRHTAYFALAAIALATTITTLVQCAGVRRRITSITETYRSALRLSKERREHIKSLLAELDRELKAVGEIQRSLLPLQLPSIPGLQIAASYQTSRRAGGDYYDFFRLPPEHPDDHRIRYGILIADVSGHGTPAAVLMAVTHSIAHSFQQPTRPPHDMLSFVNRRLCEAYTTTGSTFVTAFYAIYDPSIQTLTYSSAGHNPPRLRRAASSSFQPLDDAQGLPLGVSPDEPYFSSTRTLHPNDTLILYTDGITEARNADDEELGVPRLDSILSSSPAADPDSLLAATLTAVNTFARQTVEDDRTLLILRATHSATPDLEPKQALIIESPDNPLQPLKT